MEFLSENTRKNRKSLLLVCLIGIIISSINLKITKISLLGTEFLIENFDAIPVILGLVILYFLIAFISYGLFEYSRAYRNLREEYLQRLSTGQVFNEYEVRKEFEKVKNEISDLNHEISTIEFREEQLKIKEIIISKNTELAKLERILEFYKVRHSSFFERLRMDGIKTAVELIFPIVLAIYTITVLFFFTDIANIQNSSTAPNSTISKDLPQSKSQKIENKSDSLKTGIKTVK